MASQESIIIHDPDQLNWRETARQTVTDPRGLPARLAVAADDAAAVCRTYPMAVNPYYLSLIQEPGDPLWKQVIPDPRELADTLTDDDPLTETAQSPVPGLIHRYPDRVVLLASARCPVVCRFCFRKRMAGKTVEALSGDRLDRAVAYIQAAPGVREVILSGGDPLMLEDADLYAVCEKIAAIGHVETLRVHTRVPFALPRRVTAGLAALLKEFAPLYVNVHVNHPLEVTEAAAMACARLADAGIPLGSQTVLLKGVNDDAKTMTDLMRALLRIRVRPYYLHHPDLVRGTGHFRPSIQTGLAVMRALVGNVSGSAVPRYVIDLPGGGGKVPLLPEYVERVEEKRLVIRNYRGERFYYPTD
ncbi:MAG: KamA family radical SAM protein [Thermodesulfobacteriota bacterium]